MCLAIQRIRDQWTLNKLGCLGLKYTFVPGNFMTEEDTETSKSDPVNRVDSQFAGDREGGPLFD